MTHITNSPTVSARVLVSSAVLLAAVITMSVPAFAHAATYLYVSQTGFVSTVAADNSALAMSGALNIDMHSGVLLVDSPADTAMVGMYVPVR